MMKLQRPYIAYGWRIPKAMIALLALELPLTVATLTLYGVADPNTYRTKLWQNGYDEGFNSAPNSILYDYANYRTPHVPMVWSAYLVQFNIVISVFSTFILLVKATMFVLHCWIPILSVVIHLGLLGLYAASLKFQSTPDMSDPDHPSPGLPWYLSKGCSYATKGNHGYCMQARAVFGMTCVMVALFSIYILFSCYSLIATDTERAEREESRQSDIEMKKVLSYSPDAELSQEEKWERNRQIFLNLPKTPNTPGYGMKNPMTPRTVAFTQLSGEAGQAPINSRGPTGGLKFREQYGDSKMPDGR